MKRIRKVLKVLLGETKCLGYKIFAHKRIRKTGKVLMSLTSQLQVDKGSKLVMGNFSTIEAGSFLAAVDGGSLHVGQKVYINRNCCIVARDAIVLEDGVSIGPNCCVYDHDHDCNNRGEYIAKPILIKKGAWLGAGCIILKGVIIGENAVVAAGTVVTKNIPDRTIVYSQTTYKYKKIGD